MSWLTKGSTLELQTSILKQLTRSELQNISEFAAMLAALLDFELNC